ncbi:hypothetical protein [Clostridium kluyveri]|uniref:Uncharacterized protein n=1 Tax=Clostridium kluyveri TaxID=1534 RepID=A0A1L5FEG3_CLOKL|nr:hypothetical protein [Clostridium kluyveri]APM41396.1 hypothetical protein BS101_22075 [Clostridium kluyveri]
MSELIVTNIEELKKNATQIIQIEDFSGEGTINVRVKRLSILGLCRKGQIPNQLLGTIKGLFYGGSRNLPSMDLKEMGGLFDIISENVLVEPTMKQLEEADIQLTDTQKMQLWAYSQQGVEGLKSFRKIAEDSLSNINGKNVQTKAKPNFKHRK